MATLDGTTIDMIGEHYTVDDDNAFGGPQMVAATFIPLGAVERTPPKGQMIMELDQNVAVTILVRMRSQSSLGADGLDGLTVTVTSSKAGAAFASIAPTQTARSDGYYAFALTAAMVDTLGELVIVFTAAGAYTEERRFKVVKRDVRV